MRSFDTAKYFRRNPVKELDAGEKQVAVVIPAYDELNCLPETLTRLFELPGVEKAVVIPVVNHPPGADEKNSLLLLEKLRQFPVTALYLPDNPGGVGAARKAGMDAFLASVPPEDLENTVIFSLDADTLTGNNYFTSGVPAVRSGGTVTFGFAHRPAADPAAQCAIDRYERYLRRYVEKLAQAGSPYAFFTIGSAFAVRGDIYIRCGGMKVRHAGEDFYFLQAAAKCAGVKYHPEIVVYPSPRVSHRVPFGTGPAVQELLNGGELQDIPDAAFLQLHLVLTAATFGNLQDPAVFLEKLPEKSRNFFIREGFAGVWERVLKNLPKRQGAEEKAFHEWFDGLKTLRFLHYQGDF